MTATLEKRLVEETAKGLLAKELLRGEFLAREWGNKEQRRLLLDRARLLLVEEGLLPPPFVVGTVYHLAAHDPDGEPIRENGRFTRLRYGVTALDPEGVPSFLHSHEAYYRHDSTRSSAAIDVAIVTELVKAGVVRYYHHEGPSKEDGAPGGRRMLMRADLAAIRDSFVGHRVPCGKFGPRDRYCLPDEKWQQWLPIAVSDLPGGGRDYHHGTTLLFHQPRETGKVLVPVTVTPKKKKAVDANLL